MKREKLATLYKKYDLTEDDVYKHKHYTIITRTGIDKVQAIERIDIMYHIEACQPDFCVVKALASKDSAKIQTFGSAKHGDYKSGNTTTWYVAEMAEKRAMSRAVLKLTGFYELGVFGEEESEDFKRPVKAPPKARKLVLKKDTENYAKAVQYMKSPGANIETIKKKYDLAEGVEEALVK